MIIIEEPNKAVDVIDSRKIKIEKIWISINPNPLEIGYTIFKLDLL